MYEKSHHRNRDSARLPRKNTKPKKVLKQAMITENCIYHALRSALLFSRLERIATTTGRFRRPLDRRRRRSSLPVQRATAEGVPRKARRRRAGRRGNTFAANPLGDVPGQLGGHRNPAGRDDAPVLAQHFAALFVVLLLLNLCTAARSFVALDGGGGGGGGCSCRR